MIRLGIIGAGPNGRGNATHFGAHADRCRITAVCDVNEQAATELAAAHQARVLTRYEEMWPEIDAVAVCSPNWLHPEQSMAAARAGKHIYCEKPMALTAADAQAMREAAEKAGIQTMIGFSVRFSEVSQTMLEWQRQGKAGPWISLWTRRLGYWDDSKVKGWRMDYTKSGGYMAEIVVHEIDWMVALAGWPQSVYGRHASRRHSHPMDNEHLWITLNFPGTSVGTLEQSMMSAMPEFYQGATAANGSLYTDKWRRDLFWIPNGQKEGERLVLEPAFDKHGHFLDVIEGKAVSCADFRHGERITRLAETILQSSVANAVMPFQP